MTTLSTVRSNLAQLVAFDTTSRGSNLALIDWVEAELAPLGAAIMRLPNAEGDKANLWVRFGPDRAGGVILSGHTDVVPVDGQPWTSDPWTLTEREGRLHGRGACDMKGFLALCMAFGRAFASARLAVPVHFAFSYDEEIGCSGIIPMIEAMAAQGARADAVWVGEPTLWGVVTGHKGIRDYTVTVTGKAAHSSDPRWGVSAIHEAIELLNVLRGIARACEAAAPSSSAFDPSWSTLTIGTIAGGTAHNILARECRFGFDLRVTPGGADPDTLLRPFFDAVEAADRRLAAVSPECGVAVRMNAGAPALFPTPENAAERLLRELTGDNTSRTAAYATEAGQFQTRGFAPVICGPGSIEQAHQPDEYVAIAELQKGVAIFERLLTRMCG